MIRNREKIRIVKYSKVLLVSVLLVLKKKISKHKIVFGKMFELWGLKKLLYI